MPKPSYWYFWLYAAITGKQSVLTFSLAQSTMKADPLKSNNCDNNDVEPPEQFIPPMKEAAIQEELPAVAGKESEEFIDFAKLPFMQRQAASETILQTY